MGVCALHLVSDFVEARTVVILDLDIDAVL